MKDLMVTIRADKAGLGSVGVMVGGPSVTV
jgi:hypothetical protein